MVNWFCEVVCIVRLICVCEKNRKKVNVRKVVMIMISILLMFSIKFFECIFCLVKGVFSEVGLWF